MNKNVIIILVGAILTALVVAFSVQSMLSSDGSDNGPNVDLVEILVASEKLTQGEVISESKVRWQQWPKSALINGVYQKTDETVLAEMSLIDKPVRRSVEMGEPILSSVVLLQSQGNFLAANLQPGMLAYSIPVSAASSVGGFARPGDHVDVILTYDVRVDSKQMEEASALVKKYASETILKGIRVMAVDQTAKEDEREAKIGKVVTLEVTPDGAEVLALALEMGDISLALRHLGDIRDSEEQSVDSVPTTDVRISKTLQTLRGLSTAVDMAQQDIEGAATQSGDLEPRMGTRAVIRVYQGGRSDTVSNF